MAAVLPDFKNIHNNTGIYLKKLKFRLSKMSYHCSMNQVLKCISLKRSNSPALVHRSQIFEYSTSGMSEWEFSVTTMAHQLCDSQFEHPDRFAICRSDFRLRLIKGSMD